MEYSPFLTSSIIAQFNLDDPYIWCPTLSFTHEGSDYSSDLEIHYSEIYSARELVSYDPAKGSINFELTIYASSNVYSHIIPPSTTVYDIGDPSSPSIIMDSSTSAGLIQTAYTQDSVQYSLPIELGANLNSTYSIVAMFPDCDWIDPVIKNISILSQAELQDPILEESEPAGDEDPETEPQNNMLVPGILISTLSVAPCVSVIKAKKQKFKQNDAKDLM